VSDDAIVVAAQVQEALTPPTAGGHELVVRPAGCAVARRQLVPAVLKGADIRVAALGRTGWEDRRDGFLLSLSGVSGVGA
jgi:hypothetical protein